MSSGGIPCRAAALQKRLHCHKSSVRPNLNTRPLWKAGETQVTAWAGKLLLRRRKVSQCVGGTMSYLIQQGFLQGNGAGTQGLGVSTCAELQPTPIHAPLWVTLVCQTRS